MARQKYVRLKEYDEVIIFPEILQHSKFKNWDVVSAGFCCIHPNKIVCFGESISLGLSSDKKDSFKATRQVMGWESANKLLDKNNDDEQ